MPEVAAALSFAGTALRREFRVPKRRLNLSLLRKRTMRVAALSSQHYAPIRLHQGSGVGEMGSGLSLHGTKLEPPMSDMVKRGLGMMSALLPLSSR